MFGGKNPFIYLQQEMLFDINPYSYDSYADLRPDESYAQQLVTLGLVPSLEPYKFRSDGKVPMVNGSVLEEFSGFVVYPDSSDFFFLKKFLVQNNVSLETRYCTVFVPFLFGPYFPPRINNIRIYFFDENDCLSFGNQVVQYYTQNYKLLCNRSSELIEMVSTVLEKNNIHLDKKCTSLAKTALFITPPNIQNLYLSALLISFLASLFFMPILLHKLFNQSTH